MSRRRFMSMLAIIIVTVAAGCSGPAEIRDAETVDALGEALEAAGLRVKGPLDNDVISARLFSEPGVNFQASGETVLAYEFATLEEAAGQAAIVSPDGYGIGFKYVNWTGTPHFYSNGRLIVIYDGGQSLITDVLSAAMGEPFAGGDDSSS